MTHRFVAWPEDNRKTYLYSAPDLSSKKFRQVLWGDFLKIDGEEGDWFRIIWAPNDDKKRKTVFIPKSDTLQERPLEIIFLDVGQGDGAVLITPETGAEERIMLIDAGESDNMARFINGRFKAYRGFDFDAAILTHPDKDHYFGFLEIFSDHNIGFQTIYQNGLVERPVSGTFKKIGASEKDPETNRTYFTELATSRADLEPHFINHSDIDRFDFPPVMRAALTNPKITDFKMLSTEHGIKQDGAVFMPSFAPSDHKGYTIEVLGPVVEKDAQSRPRLRKIGSYGETKNGHSILLRLQFGDFSVLFGGDLNEPAEKFLLRHYGNVSKTPQVGTAAYRNMIALAAKKFRSDVMKSCHHGSEKVTDAFLETVNPAAFVISSGDQESHVHPRPDLLGRLGMFGRGGAPVILSTEMLRSTRERDDAKLKSQIEKALEKLAQNPTPNRVKRIKEQLDELAALNVEVYGAIYLKTDGDRLMVAFRVENKSLLKRWFYYSYKMLPNGELIRMHKL